MIKKVFLIFLGGLFLLIACTPIYPPETTILEIEPQITVTAPQESRDLEREGLSETQILTLQSLKQIDDYTLYQMTYFSEYDILVMNSASALCRR